MQAQEALQKILRRIASGTHGQVPEVRTFMGRQLLFLRQNTELFALPYVQSEDLQDLEPGSPDFGSDFFIIDIDDIDGDAVLA